MKFIKEYILAIKNSYSFMEGLHGVKFWFSLPFVAFKIAYWSVQDMCGPECKSKHHKDEMNTALSDSGRFRVKEDEIYKNDLCICKHERKDHRKSRSINFTEGGCGLCECKNFMMSAGQSNNSL